jgi:hypothetical protein
MNDNHNTTLHYLAYWIGLGDNDLFAGLEGNHPNPSSQFLVYKRPPRITSKRKYTLQIGSAVKIIRKNKETVETNGQGMYQGALLPRLHMVAEDTLLIADMVVPQKMVMLLLILQELAVLVPLVASVGMTESNWISM